MLKNKSFQIEKKNANMLIYEQVLVAFKSLSFRTHIGLAHTQQLLTNPQTDRTAKSLHPIRYPQNFG